MSDKNNTVPDDSTNKSAIYFEYYQQGLNINEIAELFGRSVNTVRKYLSQHDQYKAPGKGNRVTGKNRKVRSTTKKVVETNVLTTFYCPPDLLAEVDKIPGTKTSKIIAGLRLLVDKFNQNGI